MRIAALLSAVVLLASCGGHSRFNAALTPAKPDPLINAKPVNPPAPSDDTLKMLSAQLEAELSRLGKSASSTPARVAPSDGDEVNDLTPVLLDPDGNGAVPPYGVSLRWAERLLGDYDQNGEVGLSDLSKLGQYLNYNVKYDAPELHGGLKDIPSGDPNDMGDVAAGAPPSPTSGAFNWRLARIDGNRDGVIDVHDITPLAQHWHEAITGYIAQRQGPQDADFVKLTSSVDPAGQVSIRRFDLLAKVDPNLAPYLPIEYVIPDFFILDPPVVGSQYKYKVTPFCSDIPAAGPDSPQVTVQPFDSQQSNDGVVPIVTVTLLDAKGQPTGGPVTDIEGTLPFTLRFDASGSYIPSGKTANFLWDFDGDGVFEVSSGANPVQDHLFTENGRFDASVSIVLLDDANQKTTSAARTASVTGSPSGGMIKIVVNGSTGNHPPVAKLKADKQIGTIPLPVNFDASQSTDSDGTIKFYEWDFNGDGVADFTGTTPTATYTYGIAGQYTITLKVTDDQGGFATTTLPVITSNTDGNWPPSATLIVNPAFGAAPLDVRLDGSRSLDPDGQIVKYEWDIDGDFNFDVDSGSQAKLDYTFPASGIFNVWLRITDLGGLTSLARTTVKVNTPPFGGLEASPLSGAGPLTVNFDASTSLDLDGTIVKYEWDFNGDGVYDQDTGTVPRVTKTLYKIGLQHVVVRLTDNLGFTGTAKIDINVLTPKNNLTPTVTLAANPAPTVPPAVGNNQTITFIATGLDPDQATGGGVDHFDWDFDGDGVIDLQASPDLGPGSVSTIDHTFTDYGLYNVTVWVVDNVGSETSASLPITIWDGSNVPPTAAFSAPPSALPNVLVHFDASASTDTPPGSVTSYSWDFGDGSPVVTGGAAVTHTFTVKKSYNVVLRVTDNGGSTSVAHQDLVIGEVPAIKLQVDRAYTEFPNGVINLDASRSVGVEGNITLFEWDFDGDGVIDRTTGSSPYAAVKFVNVPFTSQDQTAPHQILVTTPVGAGGIKFHPLLRVTNEIGAVSQTSLADDIFMPATDANGEPARDSNGNLLTDKDANGNVLGVKLEPVKPLKAGAAPGSVYLYDDYDEVEGNDSYQTANWLIGPGPGGTFRPLAAGDTIQAVQPGLNDGTQILTTRTENFTIAPNPPAPIYGNCVEGSLGQRLLAEYYDGGDSDWYAFKLSSGGAVQAYLDFDVHGSPDPVTTDLILRLYDANGIQALAQGQTVGGGPATFTYNFRDPGTYYLRVNRFVGRGEDYRLFLKTTPLTYNPEGTRTVDLAGNPKNPNQNDDPANPSNVLYADNLELNNLNYGPLIDNAWGNLNYSGGDKVDWYYFYYASPVTVRVSALFKHTLGDIDIFLYDNNLSLLGYSNTTDDNETIWRTLPDPGGPTIVFLKVVAASGGSTNYNLQVGFPPGAPTGLTASSGSFNGKVHINWNAPVGGNSPNGYDVYYSDSQYGVYTKLDHVVSAPYDHDLTATANVPLQNTVFWYKVKATLTGQQDSDFSAPVLGVANGLKAPVGLAATNQYLDHVDLSFYSAPFDPALGTGNFGVVPTAYQVYADPAGALPNTLIAVFNPDDGTDVTIPALGGLPNRPGKQYSMRFTGAPNWTIAQLKTLNIVFTVHAVRLAIDGSWDAAATVNGSVPGLALPTGVSATKGLLPDQVRISWSQPYDANGQYPDGYQIQYQGEFDSGWTILNQQLIPYTGGTNYDYYSGTSGIPEPARKYQIRAVSSAAGNSAWSSSYYGYCQNNALKVPSYVKLNATASGDPSYPYHMNGTRYQPSTNSLMPLYYNVRFLSPGASPSYDSGWKGWRTFFTYLAVDTYNINVNTQDFSDNRQMQVYVAWRDPLIYGYGAPSSTPPDSTWTYQYSSETRGGAPSGWAWE